MSAPVATMPMYEPAPEFPEEIVVPLTGRIPDGLHGALYRNGPADFDAGGFHAAHPFDGDGLLAKFVIGEGQVRFRSRYVDTPKRRRELWGEGAGIRGIYTQAARFRNNVGRLPADTANTHAVVHADRLLALSDAGRPWDINPEDLTTIGPCDFGGALPRFSRFSPHPRIDPATGELFNFGLDISAADGRRLPGAVLRCFRVSPNGTLTRLAAIPLRHLYIQHDFAITPNYLVFALAPITVSPVEGLLAGLGMRPLGDAADYRPEQGMTIVLVPRAGGPHRIVECDPLVYVHVDNAHEDRGEVVLDVIRHHSFEFIAAKLKGFRTELPTLGWPARLRISTSGTVEVTDYPSSSCEFPTHDPRFTGRKQRYTYLSAQLDGERGAIVKMDRSTGRQETHDFGPQVFAGEPVHVPRAKDSAEGDGWVLAVIFNGVTGHNELHILDARAIDGPACAIAELPSRNFPGFHGSFDRFA